MEYYNSEAFGEINWDAGYAEIEGEVVEVPRVNLRDTRFYVNYFMQRTNYDDFVYEIVDQMSTENDVVLDWLDSPDFVRNSIVMLEEAMVDGDFYLSKKDMKRLSGSVLDDSTIQELEDKGLIKSKYRSGEEVYSLEKNSDAYWLMELNNEIRKRGSQSQLKKPDNPSENQRTFQIIGSQATSWDEFFSTWNDPDRWDEIEK